MGRAADRRNALGGVTVDDNPILADDTEPILADDSDILTYER